MSNEPDVPVTLRTLGELKKKEVRNIALEYNLENAKRDESMDLCFVVDNDYKQFLHEFMNKNISFNFRF